MLAGIHALVRAAVRGVQISRRADIRQTLRIALEREALPDELLAEIAGLERIIGMGSFAGYLIEKADILVAAGEQPEIVTLTKMFLGKHALEDGPFRCQFPDVYGASNLLPRICSKSLFSSTTMTMWSYTGSVEGQGSLSAAAAMPAVHDTRAMMHSCNGFVICPLERHRSKLGGFEARLIA